MIKAIIFDMDGVLIDAKDWHYDALNRALKLFGFEINRFEHLTTFDGLPTRTKLKMLSVVRGLPVELHDFINEMKQSYTLELVHAQCKPRFVHEFALSQLKAKGYKLGVASNSVRNTVEVMMKLACLAQYFDVSFSNEDVVHPKPSPEIYIAAMEKLGLSPSSCLVVEDNENGVVAARASGAHVLVVADVNDVSLANIEAEIERIEGGA
jgi:HAD superfamily hydrolase (TIGR01509 family)